MVYSFSTAVSVQYPATGFSFRCSPNISLPSYRPIRCSAFPENSPKPASVVPPLSVSAPSSVKCNAVADKKSASNPTSFPTEGKVITCKAAVAWKAKEPLVIQDIQVDPPKKGEVRLKILYTSLCHTDVTFWLDKSELGMFPRIFGHESAGIVESVGEGVTDLKPGDHVLPVFTGECKNCRHCTSTKSNLCANNRIDVTRGTMLLDDTYRFHANGKDVYNFLGSTFTEYSVMEHQNIVKVSNDAPLDKICVLSCGVTTGFGSSWKYAKVEKGSTVAVFGLGTIGLAVAEGARVAGASRIIGVDLNQERFEQAKVFGVTDFVNPKDHTKEVHDVILEMTDGGVDYSFECVGSARVVESSLLCVHDGWGMAVVVGVEGKSTKVSIHPNQFLFGRTLTGVFFGGVKPRTELPQIVDMCTRKEIQLNEFITHELPFSQINDAFKLMLDGKGLRCVMHMGK